MGRDRKSYKCSLIFNKIMNKRIFSVYVNLQDRELNLPSYLDNSKFIISICPSSIRDGTFSNKGIEEVKKLLEKGCLLGQRGYIGRCRYPHKDGIDPWHENFCLYNPPISLESQLELMTKSKEILKKTFGIEPIVYAPINHLYDENTLSAVQTLKYNFMMDQNNFGINPYKQNGVIIIPESKIGDKETSKSLGIYSHVDMLRKRKVSDFVKRIKLILPSEFKPENVPEHILTMSEIQKRIKKHERDLKSLKRKHNIK